MNTLIIVALVTLWLVVIALGAAVLALYHHFGQMYIGSRQGREDLGPQVGEPAPPVEERALNGNELALPGRGTAAVLLFTDTSCRICLSLRDELSVFSRYASASLARAVFCQGRQEEVERWAAPALRFTEVVHDAHGRIAARYRAYATPFGVAVDSAGHVVGKGLINDSEGLQWLAGLALERRQSVFIRDKDGKEL